MTAIHIDASQGLLYEVIQRLATTADSIHVSAARSSYQLGDVSDFRLESARIRQFIDLLDQIGWQASSDVTLDADPAFLQELFTDIAVDSEACVDDLTAEGGAGWSDPRGSLENYRTALDAAEQALAQLGGRLPAAEGRA